MREETSKPKIRELPARLLSYIERALGTKGAYDFVCSLSQDQIDQLIQVAIVNEWIPKPKAE